ncbi:MAG: response regulator [Deltaproteobacteria bacterium]|nr:response regulator [Deltaproteobacteria bacterium]
MEKRRKGQATILIVEDRELDREMLTTLLEHAQYRVLEAADGPQALEMTHSKHPDLIISDMLLPKMDGYQLVRQLRADPTVSGTSVIFYTAAFNEHEAWDLAREIGVDRILSKPMDPEKILENVAEVLRSQSVQPVSSISPSFEEKHLQLLVDKLIAQVKELQHSEEDLQKKNQLLLGINRIVHEALTYETEVKLGETCLDVAEELTGAKFGFIDELNQDGKLDTTAISYLGWEVCKIPGTETLVLPKNLHVHGIYGICLKEGRTVIVNDPATHPGRIGVPEGHPPITSFLGVPLTHAGKAVGLIGLGNKEGGFTDADREAVEVLAPAIVEAFMRMRTEEALRESEERFRLLIAGVKDYAIFMLDSEGRVVSWNEGAQRIKGWTAEEIMGQQFSRFYTTEEVATGQPQHGLEMAMAQGRYETEGWRVCKDGSYFWANITITALYDDQKRLRGFVKVTRDVTERKRQEDERQKLLAEQQALTEELTATNEELATQAEELTIQKEELERLNDNLKSERRLLEMANEELESFSYSVSHDLKTPIRAIEGFSRMLMAEHTDKLDAEGHRLLQVITTNTKLMHHFIDDLLALSRLGRWQLRKSVVNLNSMARQVFEQFRAQELERNLQLILKDLPPGLGDQSLLYQVMQNLIGNAVKFTGSREKGIIEAGGWSEDKENIYYVKDNGVGFDERYVTNLFRPFQRLHICAEFEGTGIGLAIVKRIIQRHGGRVWAEGKLGEGATFYFTLPFSNGEGRR